MNTKRQHVEILHCRMLLNIGEHSCYSIDAISGWWLWILWILYVVGCDWRRILVANAGLNWCKILVNIGRWLGLSSSGLWIGTIGRAEGILSRGLVTHHLIIGILLTCLNIVVNELKIRSNSSKMVFHNILMVATYFGRLEGFGKRKSLLNLKGTKYWTLYNCARFRT